MKILLTTCKRVLAMLLIILCVTAMFACRKAAPPNTSMEFNLETDNQYYLFHVGEYRVAESPDGYYYVSWHDEDQGFLHFVEKATMQDTILCGKPNCLHGKEEDPNNCNAYLGDGNVFSSVFYYQGALYTVAETLKMPEMSRSFDLIRISLDGSSRRAIWEMEWEFDGTGEFVTQHILHRGNLYFVVENPSIDYEKRPTYLYVYDLKTKKRSLLYEGQGVQQLFARGDYLFFQACEDNPEEYSLYRRTISTGEQTIFTDVFPREMCDTGMLLYTPEGEFFSDIAGENRQEIKIDKYVFTAANETYQIATDMKVTYKPENRVTTYDEYLAIHQEYPGHMAPEEDIREWDRRLKEYEILYSPHFNVYDTKAMEFIGTVPIPEEFFVTEPNERGYVDYTIDPSARCMLFFREDKIWLYSQNFGVFYTADVSTLGSPDFAWSEPSRIFE